MKMTALLVVVVSLAPLAACADPDLLADEGRPAPDFGAAQRHNLAVQIANPDAPATNEPLKMDGQRAALALDRYEKGKVIQPADVSIGTVGGTGSSGGGTSQ